MPKTRQQRMAEAQAGHQLSPQQVLEDKPRGPKRTRAKTPSAAVVAGPVVPAAQSAVLGEPQALLHVWVDAGPETSGRPLDDPTHELTIPSSLVPELVKFLENIRNKNVEKVPEASSMESADQEMPSQAMAEAIQPTQPELVQNTASPAQSQRANGPTNKKRPPFRRNSLLPSPAVLKSLPATAALNKSAVDATPVIFRRNPKITSTLSDNTASHQPNDELSTAEDSDMDGASENGSMISQSTKSTLPIATQLVHEGKVVPETPQGGKWGFGRLIQSARSITKRFSPLSQVSDVPESSLQMSAMGTARVPTETAVLAQPKKKSSPTISVRDARARNRRQNDLAIKPVKTITTGKTRRDKAPRAKRARLESGEAEGLGSGDDNFSATESSNRNKGQLGNGEAGQAESQEPEAKPAIRWPSRSLDRMNQNKRKRWGEPVAGPIQADVYGDSADNETDQQPGKIRRTGASEDFTSQVAGNSHAARPYIYQGGNVFAEYEAAQRAESARQQSLPKTPTPITNPTGTFKVPSPGDSDWSDSGSEEDEGNITGLENTTPSRANNEGVVLAQHRNPPSKIPVPQQYEALRKARAKALRYKPRNPSRLYQSSRAYPSPPVPSEAALGNHGGERMDPYNSFAEWVKTASAAVTAALENMDVDSNFAGQAFKSGFDNFTEPK